jgi:hypothetical protein
MKRDARFHEAKEARHHEKRRRRIALEYAEAQARAPAEQHGLISPAVRVGRLYRGSRSWGFIEAALLSLTPYNHTHNERVERHRHERALWKARLGHRDEFEPAQPWSAGETENYLAAVVAAGPPTSVVPQGFRSACGDRRAATALGKRVRREWTCVMAPARRMRVGAE